MKRVLFLAAFLAPATAYAGDLSDYVPLGPVRPYQPSDSSDLSDKCPSGVENIEGLIEFDDPYQVEGKCFSVILLARFGNFQWIDKNTILINDSSPYETKIYSTIVE